MIILETTVPPGTSEKIILPIIQKEFKKRGYKNQDINFIYSYERVMPGKEYLNSIKNFWRVYSSNNEKADRLFKKFCSYFINLKKFPMTKLDNLRSAETAKILENSYRATNIAFIQEWTEYSKNLKINLFPIIKAIKIRPTHQNIMRPGLGVGGYCLTKDPLFGKISHEKFYRKKLIKNNFHFSSKSVILNNKMPMFTFNCISEKFKSLNNKKVLFLGITYKSDVQDTRHSPTTTLAKKFQTNGCSIFFYDDLCSSWPEIKKAKFISNSKFQQFDIIIYYLNTKIGKNFDFSKLKQYKGLVVDVSNILSLSQQRQIKNSKINHCFIGNFN